MDPLLPIKTWIARLLRPSDAGVGMIEYVLLASLIAIALIAAVNMLAGGTGHMFSSVGKSMGG